MLLVRINLNTSILGHTLKVIQVIEKLNTELPDDPKNHYSGKKSKGEDFRKAKMTVLQCSL
jgi:hypothetical protein